MCAFVLIVVLRIGANHHVKFVVDPVGVFLHIRSERFQVTPL